MTTIPRTAERRITAYVDNLESRNVIHTSEAASQYGFRGALVTGVVVYGWGVPAIIELLGERWLDDGWVEMRFRRPTYAGDTMTALATERGDGSMELAISNQDGEVCVVGSAGLGRAEWFADLPPALFRAGEPPSQHREALTLADAPIGQDLRPMAIAVTEDDAATFAERVRDDDPRWSGDGALIHPQWLASQMYQLLLHSYECYPSMHVRSQIQHLAPLRAAQTLTLAARFVEAYECRDNHYATLEGGIFDAAGSELMRVRYNTVFHVAKRH